MSFVVRANSRDSKVDAVRWRLAAFKQGFKKGFESVHARSKPCKPDVELCPELHF